MGLGVLDDQKLEHVPGTVFLNEDGAKHLDLAAAIEGTQQVAAGLKHANNIVLVPQPSSSPHDPLNWTKTKKELFTIAFAFGCGCVGAVGPLLSAAAVQLSIEWVGPNIDTSIQVFSRQYNGVLLGCVALSSVFSNTLAVKFGKRPILLVSSILLAVGQFWGGASHSLGSLTGSRALTGIGVGPWEALLPASISDVWFVHQRGFRIAIFNLGVIGGIDLVSPIAGSIIQNYGWRNCMYGMGGAYILQTILVFFFMPETAYHRADVLNIDMTSHEDLSDAAKEVKADHVESSEPDPENSHDRDMASIQRSNWISARELLPWSGYSHKVNLFWITVRPFKLVLSPPVAWGTILYMTCISWLVLIAVTISQIFALPPYNFSVEHVGLTNLSSFVASVLAAAVAQPLSDGIAVYMSKRNGGVYEPEFRLPLVVSYLMFTAVGFFVWGESAYQQEPWPVPVIVGLGLVNFGIILTTTAVAAYVVDCHRELAGETFALIGFVTKVFAMGVSFYVNDWLVADGIRNTFFTLGGITAGLTLTTIPMYIWGKRSRSWYHRHCAFRQAT